MEHANGTSSSDALLSDTEFEMVKHIIPVQKLEDLSLTKCCIYIVPSNLRSVNKDAYTPQSISIGPIHCDKPELKPMQEHKKHYFHFFWQHVSNEGAMRTYKNYLEEKEPDIRQCYSMKFPEVDKAKFVDIILLDAVFIMELLLRNSSLKCDNFKHEHEYKHTQSFREEHSNDPIMAWPWLSRNISMDLILLENQIPFYVLQELYDTVVIPGDRKKKDHASFSFVDLAIEYFAFYDTQKSSSEETKKVMGKDSSRKNPFSGSLRGSTSKPNPRKGKDLDKNPEHFTDLIRYFFLPTKLGDKSGSNDHVLRTATKLQDSGVSFENALNKRLLDITFEKKPILSLFLCLGCIPYWNHFRARLRIPQLKVDHTTERVLRNLIALEQCHYPEKPYICNYVILIDSLIHTQHDVELLVEKEIIVHELGSDKEVATLVNGLSKHVVANFTFYYKTINDLNKHYQNFWNRTMAALKLVYFRDPWRASGTLVGIAVLIFAVFQFLRAVRYLF